MTMRPEHVGLTAAHLAVGCVLSASDDLDEAAELVMQSLGETLHWKVIHLWCVEDGRLTFRRGWHVRGFDCAKLEDRSRHLRTESLQGLLGRAMTRMLPVWSVDIANEPYCTRRAAAAACGINACVVVPIVHMGTSLGALELFDTHRDAPTQHYLTSLRCMGLHLGEFMARVAFAGIAMREQERGPLVSTAAGDAEIVVAGHPLRRSRSLAG